MAKPRKRSPRSIRSDARQRGQSRSVPERRRAAAREALSGMKGGQSWVPGVDDRSLDFLVTEVSEQMMLELARTWTARGLGYPTSSKLATLAESVHLEVAVAALDG